MQKIAFNVEPYIIDKCDMDIVLHAEENKEEMIPFFSIASIDFDKDLGILKKFYINLSKGRIQKMLTGSAKGQH